MENILNALSDFAWGPIIITMLVGTGIYLSLSTRFVQFRKLALAFKLLFKKTDGDGDITPFQSLMTSLAATVGTGNIAGVASAIISGGPGAIFWMWVTAAFGGATKFAEAVLAIKYRETNESGEKSGGPMYYIKNGMPKKFHFLAYMFAFFGLMASFGIGNMVQSNSVATALNSTLGVPKNITGLVITISAGLVILGGIKSIGKVTEKFVPFMAISYIVGALVILFINANLIPAAFKLIFSNAFTSKAVAGGLIGTVIRYGVARGVFSNEAGLGSAAIAHAASKNDNPVTQGIIGSLGSFIDTLVICTLTALVILTSNLVKFNTDGLMEITGGFEGADLTAGAFSNTIPTYGGYIVSFGLVFFAFSTILGWFYYGSKCLEFLAGYKAVIFYKLIYISLIFVGAITSLQVVWKISDIFNGFMAIPNLIALVALSPVILKELKQYERKSKLDTIKTYEKAANN